MASLPSTQAVQNERLHQALGPPHARRLNPSAASIGAIVIITLVLSAYIYRSVNDGFQRYDDAVAMIRAQREALTDLLDADTAASGYIDTRESLFIGQYEKAAKQVLPDVRRIEVFADRISAPYAALLLDRLRESQQQYDADIKNLFTMRRVSDRDQEVPRRLQVAMRSDLASIQNAAKAEQDATIERVRYTVMGGSAALLLSVITLGLLGIVADNARRREQRRLTLELDARNRELERSNTALADFAYVASHDLQEPLRTVTSYTQLLSKRYGDKLDADGSEFIGYASDAAKRMERLIDDLLEYSHVISHDLEPVQSEAELETATRNLKERITETGTHIEWSPLPAVLANRGQLAVVFQNLVGNAIKYRAPDRPPVVRIEARREGTDWVFSVADNGIGIDPQHFERIFKMFQRLHARSQYDGTGIGLAVVKRIIDLHGGRIWVESDPGQGSTFFFTLSAVS